MAETGDRLASRAFFRCRACGEPVVARAFRCPVCGIDFPAGTPGTPRVPEEPAETAPPEAEQPAPSPDDLAALNDDDGPDETLGPQEESIAEANAKGDARLNVRPAGARRRARRAAARANKETPPVARQERPRREAAAVVVAKRQGKAVVRTRRRSKVRGLAGTFFMGVLLVSAVGGGAWYFGDKVGAPLGGRAPALALSVSAEDGWVPLPREEGGLLIQADGPFRLRVNGDVYTLDGAKPVQVPAEVIAAMRIVRSPTVATVSYAARLAD